jgi:hypothetical protein
MNIKQGVRRLGILFGLCGAVTGEFFAGKPGWSLAKGGYLANPAALRFPMHLNRITPIWLLPGY